MKKYIIVLIIAGLNLTACTTLRKSTSSTASIEPDVFQYPTVVDLEVGNKIEKTETWNFNPFDKQKLKDREGNLIADMVKSENADVLLEAQSTYTKVPFGERTLTVSGYPAKYKDFRNATEEDIKAFKKLNGTDCENNNVVSQASASEKLQIQARTPKKKITNTGKEFVVRAGYALNGGLGTGLVGNMGYTAGCELNSYMKYNLYWNIGIDFSSKGFDKYRSEYRGYEDINIRTNALQIPLGIGYRLNLAKNFGVALNTSMLFSFDMSGNVTDKSYHSNNNGYNNSQGKSISLKDYDNNYSIFDFGFNIRMDIWISKIKLEVAYKPYLAKVCGTKCHSLSFGLGYAF